MMLIANSELRLRRQRTLQDAGPPGIMTPVLTNKTLTRMVEREQRLYEYYMPGHPLPILTNHGDPYNMFRVALWLQHQAQLEEEEKRAEDLFFYRMELERAAAQEAARQNEANAVFEEHLLKVWGFPLFSISISPNLSPEQQRPHGRNSPSSLSGPSSVITAAENQPVLQEQQQYGNLVPCASPNAEYEAIHHQQLYGSPVFASPFRDSEPTIATQQKYEEDDGNGDCDNVNEPVDDVDAEISRLLTELAPLFPNPPSYPPMRPARSTRSMHSTRSAPPQIRRRPRFEDLRGMAVHTDY